MKKTVPLKFVFSFLVFILGSSFLFFTISCGLDTYIVLDSPTKVEHQPLYSSIDPLNNYFEFWTYESSSYPSGFNFLGTEIYYKIYNNSSTLESERNALESIASQKETSANAATRLIETYNFKPLKVENNNNSPLIVATGKDKIVRIRLTNYQTSQEYSARVLVNDKYIFENANNSKPVRTDGLHTFDFGRNGEYDSIPTSSDSSSSTGIGDVKYGSFSETNKWYVSMFAVAVGRDGSYTNYYSNILYLGSVPIDSSSNDN